MKKNLTRRVFSFGLAITLIMTMIPANVKTAKAAPKRADITEGLIAYYDFEDCEGTTVPNIQGNTAYNGTLLGNNVSVRNAEYLGNALHFENGTEGHMKIPNVINSGENNYSISLWYKYDTSFDRENANTVLLQQNGNGRSILLLTADNRYDSYVNGVDVYSDSSVNLDEWQHVIYVYNSVDRKIKYYINGVLDSEKDAGTNEVNAVTDLLIGRHKNGGSNPMSMRGDIDEIRVYDRVLSDEEAKAVYEDKLDPPTYEAHYASKDQLLQAYDLVSSTENKPAQLVKFGLDENGQAQTWWIAGRDSKGENLVLFATKPLVSQVKFDPDSMDNDKAFDAEWGTYDTAPQTVYSNHYGASALRAKLKDMETDESYFSKAEQSLMKETTIYTNDIKNQTQYALTDKLYAAYGEQDRNYTYVTVGSNKSDDLNGGLRIDREYWGGPDKNKHHYWLRAPYNDRWNSKSAIAARANYDAQGNATGSNTYNSVDLESPANGVLPAFQLELSNILFASAAPIAEEGTLTMEDVFTLRYVSDVMFGKATVTEDGSCIEVTDAAENVYLVVQNDDGAWAQEVSEDICVQPEDVVITETGLTSFDDCKIWLETTDESRLTKVIMPGDKIEEPDPVESDKSDLDALITYAQSQKESDEYKLLVKVVKDAFDAVFASAVEVNEDVTATQEEVNAAYDALLAKVHLLGFIGGNTDNLDQLYRNALALDKKLYTEESVKVLEEAMKSADEVLRAGENALKVDIDKAYEELETAMTGLKRILADKRKLAALIAKGEGYLAESDKYVSVADLELALTSADEVYGKEDATQEEVNAAYGVLLQAIFGLREVPNKDVLEGLIKTVSAMDLSVYSNESVKSVKAALSYAKEVLADDMADQDEIDAAVEALNDAIEKAETTGKTASNATRKTAGNTTSKTGKTAAKTGDHANAEIPVAAGLVAILALIAVWKKETNV